VKLKGGKADGISDGDVAVVHGVHIVGRIARAGLMDRTCTLVPITDASAKGPVITGVIMLDDQQTGPICALKPTREGRLEGAIGYDANATASMMAAVQPGMNVRLQDPSWPASAQMLIIGQVEKIEPGTTSLRPRVVVKPVYGFERERDVVVRISGDMAGATALPPTSGAGGGARR
jgi:hypothetical protein